MHGPLAFCALFILAIAIAPWSCSNAPPPRRQHDWLVFVQGTDGDVAVNAVNAHFEASGGGYNCWALHAGEEGFFEEFDWVAPDGHIHPTPFLASRVRVPGGQWEETAARLGIDLRLCK